MSQLPTPDRERTARADTALLCLPKQFVTPSLLLLIEEEPAYGYELLQRLAALGVNSADHGAVYRALNVMEADGLVLSSWEPSPNGPRRRRYCATEDGRRLLVRWSHMLEQAEGLIRRFLDRSAGAAAPHQESAANGTVTGADAAAVLRR